jgi:hypothetical protein
MNQAADFRQEPLAGNVGQTDYAAANAFMDEYMKYRDCKAEKGERTGIYSSEAIPSPAGSGLVPVASFMISFIKLSTCMPPSFMDEYMKYRDCKAEKGERTGASITINWPLWEDGKRSLRHNLSGPHFRPTPRMRKIRRKIQAVHAVKQRFYG